MKKLLALFLAAVMLLGLSVSAFAATTAIVLELDEDDDDDDLIEVKTLDIDSDDEAHYIALGGGDYFFVLEDAEEYDDLKVEASGSVTASLVDYDPEVYGPIENYPDLYYMVVRYKSGNRTYYDGSSFGDESSAKEYSYEDAIELTEEMNDDNSSKGVKYLTVASTDVVLVKVTVEDNFTAAYKTGTVTVSGELDDEDYSYSFDVISDVIIFAYEDVKEAAEYGLDLDDDYQGYSDYLTEKNGYLTADLDEVAVYGFPTVVSTTEFRAIAGSDLSYDYGNVEITIKDVVSGQKGVNFIAYDDGYDEDDEAVKFGFPCKTVIQSDFEISLDLDCTWFDIREMFEEKLEENDIITYYVVKDGTLFDKVTVDYGEETVTIGDETESVDIADDDVSLTFEGKAGDTLGEYTIQLTAPVSAEESESEENPNTGAESAVSVVSAIAVMAVVSAAAVAMKK